jgi:exopolysaccharide biosynthesis polyprenyl glycosylphosphotransferase
MVLAGHVGLTSEASARGDGERDRRVVTLDEWGSLVVTERIDRVIVALRDLDEETLSRVASSCRSLGVKLSVAPPLRAMLGTAVDLHHLAELPLIEFRTWDPSRSTELLKRTMDVVGAGVAIVALFPWLLLIAVAVKLDSTGPALFRQTRAGRAGDPFEMLKFRTMVADAAERLHELVDVDRLSEPAFKLKEDPRITRVGRFLRRTSLDELPQLINVLRGEMSLVGPRPEEVWLVDRYGEADRFRLEMRPGMTGPMQVHGRGELSFQERMSVEREYVENYSLRKDVKILFQTLATVVGGRGAF